MARRFAYPKRKLASDEDFQLAKSDDLHLATGRDFRLAIDSRIAGCRSIERSSSAHDSNSFVPSYFGSVLK